jgi:hypothetical protein
VNERLDRDRRFVLKALACLVPTMACARRDASVTPPPPSPSLPPTPIPEAVAVLGRHYLAAHPEESDRETLRRALGLDRSDPEPLQLERIDAALRRDLDTGDVIVIEGWQLTRAECRLYALAALT